MYSKHFIVFSIFFKSTWTLMKNESQEFNMHVPTIWLPIYIAHTEWG